MVYLTRIAQEIDEILSRLEASGLNSPQAGLDTIIGFWEDGPLPENRLRKRLAR